MKNIKMISFLLIFALVLTACFNTKISDASKFKEEYEKLNGELKSDEITKYMDMEIPDDNPIVYSNYDEIMSILDNGTGVILFGFPECPWCRNAIPVLLKAADEVGLNKIYYLNNVEDRNKVSLDDDGNLVTESEGTENYKKLLEKLGDNASVYDGLNNESIRRVYFPTVFFVKDGEVIATHVSTLDSHEEKGNGNIPLTDAEKEELQLIYIKYINNVLGKSCDDDC